MIFMLLFVLLLLLLLLLFCGDDMLGHVSVDADGWDKWVAGSRPGQIMPSIQVS